jgi:hypothetical protein
MNDEITGGVNWEAIEEITNKEEIEATSGRLSGSDQKNYNLLLGYYPEHHLSRIIACILNVRLCIASLRYNILI